MRKDIKISGLDAIGLISDHPDGTLFKGKRTIEQDTIIKVWPYTVDTHNKEDPYTFNYNKELKKLKSINLSPNIHVAKIISVGLTEQDNYPFVESEFINGPDIENLLTFPKNPIFQIKEVIELALQMADALAHCHTAMVRHGGVSINNIRLNLETGYYILVNFGRLLLTDEQRKIEILNARSVEFLAPEQRKGELFFETDIYSLGLVLFQVLTGSVSENISSTLAKSTEKEVSSLTISQQIKKNRKDNLPFSWSDSEKELEMEIPEFLIKLISDCLEPDPDNRPNNGIKIKVALQKNQQSNTSTEIAIPKPIANKEVASSNLPSKTDDEKESEIKKLKALIIQKDGQLDVLKYQTADYNPDSNKLSISRPVFFTLLAILALFGIIATYAYFFRKPDTQRVASSYSNNNLSSSDTTTDITDDMYAGNMTQIDTAELLRSLPPIPQEEVQKAEKQVRDVTNSKKSVIKDQVQETSVKKELRFKIRPKRQTTPEKKDETGNNLEVYIPPVNRTPRYRLIGSKAYFYDEPDVRSRRPVYIGNSSDSEFISTRDTNGFIYVVFFNTDKQITRGWLRKQDLRKIN